jgi:hypothetical protein
MKWRREFMSPFNTSVVDIMCCGLGAVFLMFVMSRVEDAGRIAESELSMSRDRERVEAYDESAVASQERMRAILAGRSGTPFAIPVLENDVCVVLDVSTSMVQRTRRASGELARSSKHLYAEMLLQMVVINHARLKHVRVVAFATNVEEVIGWTELDAPNGLDSAVIATRCDDLMRSFGLEPETAQEIARGARIEVVDKIHARLEQLRQSREPSSTDILSALKDAFKSVSGRPGASILVVSDGDQTKLYEGEKPPNIATERGSWFERRATALIGDEIATVPLHVFCVLDQRESILPEEQLRESRDIQLVLAWSRLAARSKGILFLLPCPSEGSPVVPAKTGPIVPPFTGAIEKTPSAEHK